jgi:hypothetical protein
MYRSAVEQISALRVALNAVAVMVDKQDHPEYCGAVIEGGEVVPSQCDCWKADVKAFFDAAS